MSRYYYDLHIHSCLSPCGDNDNTPNNIAGMASLCELDIVALTDHNTCKNCPAFFAAAERYGITPVAGMELTTSEDIHIVCLFENLSDAMSFDAFIANNRFLIKNQPEIFGNQIVLDENDNFVYEEENLLINATNISVDEVYNVVRTHNGICYPAHIDRESNGLISVLGTVPQDSSFSYYELHDSENVITYSQKYEIDSAKFIISSDAHYLTDIKDKNNYFDLDCDIKESNIIRSKLFRLLRGEV